jgi:hypothetical protein
MCGRHERPVIVKSWGTLFLFPATTDAAGRGYPWEAESGGILAACRRRREIFIFRSLMS